VKAMRASRVPAATQKRAIRGVACRLAVRVAKHPDTEISVPLELRDFISAAYRIGMPWLHSYAMKCFTEHLKQLRG